MSELKCTKCGIEITEQDVMVEGGYTTKLCKNCRGIGSLFTILVILGLLAMVWIVLFK